jgi:protein tyrosine phosphatase (PTP) superfamily phosphohydrolase (DUF442 family)
MGLEEIHNYLKVDNQFSTAGQPDEDELKAVADAGFEVVINLATIDARYSLADEEGLVRSLGMAYYNIPVVWEQPLESDFVAFSRLLRQLGNKTIFIHCAANYRVTAFFSLYALQNLAWSVERAQQFRTIIWQQRALPVWQDFIQSMTEKITAEQPPEQSEHL